jgi:hypothetical protein
MNSLSTIVCALGSLRGSLFSSFFSPNWNKGKGAFLGQKLALAACCNSLIDKGLMIAEVAKFG